MTIRKRLELVERAVGTRFPMGRCSHCRDWPTTHFPKEAITVAERLKGYEPEVPTCPQCGWSPIRVVEVIVNSLEDVRALETYDQAEEKRVGKSG